MSTDLFVTYSNLYKGEKEGKREEKEGKRKGKGKREGDPVMDESRSNSEDVLMLLHFPLSVCNDGEKNHHAPVLCWSHGPPQWVCHYHRGARPLKPGQYYSTTQETCNVNVNPKHFPTLCFFLFCLSLIQNSTFFIYSNS